MSVIYFSHLQNTLVKWLISVSYCLGCSHGYSTVYWIFHAVFFVFFVVNIQFSSMHETELVARQFLSGILKINAISLNLSKQNITGSASYTNST